MHHHICACLLYTSVSETMQERLINPINQAMERFLTELTLEELKVDYQQRLTNGQDMYYI